MRDYTNDPIVQELRQRFLPAVQQLERELKETYPDRDISLWASPTGSLTVYQGYDIGIEYISTGHDRGQTLAVFEISLCHITTVPKLSAEAGSTLPRTSVPFREEVGTNDQWPEATPELLDELEADMPRLIEAFRVIVAAIPPTGEATL